MRKHILFALCLLVVLAACRPISRGPNPYQSSSPLAMPFDSPLYARGAAPAISMPGGLVAPNDARAGTISAALPAMRYTIYAPILTHQKDYPCYMNGMSAELLRLMIEDRAQQRKSPRCNELVTKVAQARADDMVKREYFSHVSPEGITPNEEIAKAGCLPDYYPKKGNTIESITLNYLTPQSSWNALVSSKGHRPHVLGLHPFFAEQNTIGVGYASNEWGTVFVIMSVPHCND